MNDRITIRVLLFARLAHDAGTRQVDLELPAGSRAADAVDALGRLYPGLSAQRTDVALAINEQYADWDKALAPGDTLALIPPVSGG